MYRVMIVDDEKFVRKSIINRIEWEQRELVLAGEADNGADALKLVEIVRPDIILADIRMPIMNGIEMIRNIKKTNPDIHFIILSGYDDFEYTKEAIKLGIANYIKKPIDETELNDTLGLIINMINLQRDSEDKLRDYSRQIKRNRALLHEKFLNNLLYHQYNIVSEESVEFGYGHFGLLLVYINEMYDDDKILGVMAETIGQVITDALKAVPFCRIDPYVFSNPLHPREIRILLNGDVLSGQMERIAALLYDYLKKRTDTDKVRHFSVSVSSVCNNARDISRTYQDCLNRLKQKILPGHANILHETDGTQADTAFSDFVYNSVSLLKGYMEKRDVQNVNRTLEKIFDSRNESKFTVGLLESIVYEIHNTLKRSMVKSDSQTPGFSANDLFQPYYLLEFNDLTELKNDIIGTLGQFFGLSHLEEVTLIEKIKHYILDHYAEDLTLSKIAEEHYLNPSYLSQLFKAKTGENISRFIEDIRVEKAKNMLSNLSVSVVDVAFGVGYNDARYFSKVFKKKTGMLPSAYQEKFIACK